MTTTEQFQTVPDVFLNTPKKIVPQKLSSSNPRYSDFKQTHFTAGDVEQFEMYRDKSNGNGPSTNIIDLSDNIWTTLEVKDSKLKKDLIGENIEWKKYSHLTTESVDNTFAYLFNKFKKGVFVKIKNNKLSVFLPFSKHNYINEWSEYMKQPPSYTDMTSFLLYASKIQCYDIKPEQVNKFVNKWYANNCLVRTEFPIGENDRCVSNLKDMLITLCKERIIPDIELFFNRRDFPLIKKDDTEPYEHIFNSEKKSLISHNYDKYCPILSMVTTNNNTDIPFPTMEDWARVSEQEHSKLFAPDFKKYSYTFEHDWDSKIPSAVFRGASTGCGITPDTNPRLKLALLSTKSPIENKIPLLDAGITKWNCRPRKIMKQEYLQLIDPSIMKQEGINLVSFLTPEQQSKYKYIINVDGHVSAFRLSLELSMGSVVLLQDSKYRVWFRKYLIPNKHYIPIKEDLSDLFEKIRWCRKNDEECKKIAENALLFYKTYLTEKGILDFVQLLFINIKNVTGSYFYSHKSVKDIIYKKQYNTFESPSNGISTLTYHFEYRNINAMAGLELYFNRHDIPYDQLILKNKEHESKDSTIYSYQICPSLLIAFKTSKRTRELVNEAFIGIECINKLIRDIPNFKYTFGFDKTSSTLLTEHVDGILFSEFIAGSSTNKVACNFNDFIGILQTLLLTLSVAQERFGFVHNDLTPWNIVIKKLDKPTRIIYQFKDQVVEVNTTILPIIIDYDRSHAIIDNTHYGIIEPFKTSRFQDCFCLFINSIYEYCMSHKKMSKEEFANILYIINFFTDTEFSSKTLTSYHELIDFLSQHKKYNEIVYRNKCDLESFEPCDYFSYIENFDHYKLSENIHIETIDSKKVEKENNYVNPLFYYDLIVQKNNHNDILDYLEKLETMIMGDMDKFLVNYIYYVHGMNQLYQYVLNVKKFIELYPCSQKTQDELFIENRNCDRILRRIGTEIDYKESKPFLPVCGHISESVDIKGHDDILFCNICKKQVDRNKQWISKFVLPATYQPNFNIAKYNVNSFSIPSVILTLLQGDDSIRNINYINIRYMIRDILLYKNYFTIPNEKEFAKKYGKLLSNFSPLSIINHNANIETLKFISKELYPTDLIELEKRNDDVEKFIRIIQNILALC